MDNHKVKSRPRIPHQRHYFSPGVIMHDELEFSRKSHPQRSSNSAKNHTHSAPGLLKILKASDDISQIRG